MNNRIAELRTAQQWSQAHLAKLAGVSRQTVIALEQAKSDPGLSVALRIAWLFRRPIESIFLADIDEQMVALNETWEYRKRSATAFDEIGILERMGDEGWEMTGFGFGSLQFRRPSSENLRRSWEYQRLSVLSKADRISLEKQGWTFLGSWASVFHYFKREARPNLQPG